VRSEITESIYQVLDHLVGLTPGVIGALASSADGFTLASHLPIDTTIDPNGLGAMGAAALALSNQLVKTTGESPAVTSHHRSRDGQVVIVPVAHIAVLTILATSGANTEQLTLVGREAAIGLERLFHGAATV
jgi:predicted regulator of Ras-like GTPase activity (Roadblock/LC7/MglB family)